MDKERFATRQEYDSLVLKQKLTQDLENEQLRQKLEELKRQSSAYLRAQHQFTQGFSAATGQFVNRVVVPTVDMASKPFANSGPQANSHGAQDVKASQEEKSAGAKVFPFAGAMDLETKAASWSALW